MKKMTRLLACISVVTTMVTGMASTCSAEQTCWGYADGSINNNDYLEYISDFEVSSVEDWVIETCCPIYNDVNMSDWTPLHIYESKYNLFFEYGKDNARMIKIGFFMGMDISSENISVTKDSLNNFLKSKGISAVVSDVSVETDENGYSTGGVGICGADGDDGDYGPIAEAYCALNKEYGFIPRLAFYESSSLFEEINGDVDGNGKLNVRDAALISSILSDGNELPDNADYNKDGEKNVRDAAAIANYLATR